MGSFVLRVPLTRCANSLCVDLLFRYTQPLAVTHATALFEASHRSINKAPPAAAAPAGSGVVDAHEEQELQRRAPVQRQEAQQQQQQQQNEEEAQQQQQVAARGNKRRRLPPEEERPPLRRSQRARTSPARQPPQPPPLRGVTPEPVADRSRAEQVTIVQAVIARMGNGHPAPVFCGHTGFHDSSCQAHGYLVTCSNLACRSSTFATRILASSHPVQRIVARPSRCANVDSTCCAS